MLAEFKHLPNEAITRVRENGARNITIPTCLNRDDLQTKNVFVRTLYQRNSYYYCRMLCSSLNLRNSLTYAKVTGAVRCDKLYTTVRGVYGGEDRLGSYLGGGSRPSPLYFTLLENWGE